MRDEVCSELKAQQAGLEGGVEEIIGEAVGQIDQKWRQEVERLRKEAEEQIESVHKEYQAKLKAQALEEAKD